MLSSRYVRLWSLAGLIIGAVAGAIIGYVLGEGTIVGWVPILAIGGFLFFMLWSYANEQERKVRRRDVFRKKR